MHLPKRHMKRMYIMFVLVPRLSIRSRSNGRKAMAGMISHRVALFVLVDCMCVVLLIDNNDEECSMALNLVDVTSWRYHLMWNHPRLSFSIFPKGARPNLRQKAWIGYIISSYSEVVEELTSKSDNTCILASNVFGSADIGTWRTDVEVRYLQHRGIKTTSLFRSEENQIHSTT